MMGVKIYPAGKPKIGDWVVEWKTGVMKAPAFWYYKTKEEAEECALRLKRTINLLKEGSKSNAEIVVCSQEHK